MTLKQAMEAVWKERGCRNSSHLNRWFDMWNDKTRAYFQIEDAPMPNFRLMAHRGKKIQLKVKRSKYRGATQPWLTPQARATYQWHRARFLEDVGKARKVLGLND